MADTITRGDVEQLREDALALRKLIITGITAFNEAKRQAPGDASIILGICDHHFNDELADRVLRMARILE